MSFALEVFLAAYLGNIMSTSESGSTSIFVKVFTALLSILVLFALVAGVFRLVKGEDESSDISWLYSQTADSGEMDDLGGGRYHIILRDVDYHTVQFSDRPDRLVKVIDTAELVKNWDTLFATSSPNAVLVEHEPDGSTDSLVVVLEKPHFDYELGELTYEAQLLADEYHPERLKKLANAHPEPPIAMRAVSLFIDSVATLDTNNGPIFTGPGAEALKNKLGIPSIPTAPLNLGSGVQLMSASVSADTSTGKVTADAVVGFSKGSFQLQMKLEATDSKNWSLTTTTASSTPWTPPSVPGLTVDPSSFTGSISSTNGVIAYSLTGATHTWQVATGATYVSTPTFSKDCPLPTTKCSDSVEGPFIAMNGSLAITGMPTVSLQGAMNTNAEWARFDGVTADVTFGGQKITSPTLTMWRGARSDSYDANMQLPTLTKLTGGNNMEFCGGFTINIPKIVNKATSGCARWSPSGVVIGQVGVNANLTGTMPSLGSTASTAANVKGLAWTNIPEASLANLPSRDAVMNSVSTAIQDKKIVLAGTGSFPGVVANALNINLGSASSLVIDVRGVVSATGFSLSGDINTNINLGKEPFKLSVRKMTATISMEKGDGASFSIGTAGDATVGYSPKTRTLQTAINMVAATSPQTGMALAVNVKGTPAASDAGKDGLTTATRLLNPAGAQFVWPDQFGIKGLNLWNLTVQIAFQNGSPALGYTSTSYMDPNGAQTGKVLTCSNSKSCTGADWMVGTLGFNISYTNPCFAYSFNSASGTSGLAIDGGIMKATSFAVGIAPTGCSIQSGDTQQSLPTGFAGFQFAASFGDATVAVATKVTPEGFFFEGDIEKVKLVGITYNKLALDVLINDEGSNIDFEADMSSGMGNMDVTSSFASNSSGVSQSLDANLTDWTWGKDGTVDLKKFHFNTSANIPTNGGCASFSTSADGSLTVGSRNVNLEQAVFAFDCNGIKNLAFKINYAHKMKWNGANANAYLQFKYPSASGGGTYSSGTKYFYGAAGFSYERRFSKKYKDRTFSRGVDVNIDMSITVNPQKPQESGFSFDGEFDADRVSGEISASLDADGGDFTAGGRLRLNPSWAGVYHHTWGDL